MRVAIRALSALALVCAGLVAAFTLTAAPAAAACPPDPVDTETGLCASVDIAVPIGNGGGGNPAAPKCPDAPGGQCQKDNAWWSPLGQCYAYPLAPQPAPGSPTWELIAGDATGGLTIMYCAQSGQLFSVPEGQSAVPDARLIALNAVHQVPFVRADVQMAPAGRPTYVHVENWLWVPAGQWRSLQARASVGGTSVTVTAAPSRVVWDMGDGHTKVCRSAGRAWSAGMSGSATTACGYTYESISVRYKAGAYDPGGRFEVSARFVYDVRWSCTGICSAPGGSLGEYSGPASAVTPVEVRQRQTVVTR